MSNNLIRGALMTSTIFAGLVLPTAAALGQTQPPAEAPAVPSEDGPTVVPQEAIADEQAALQASGEEIVVTGSRIARPNLEQSSPVTVVGSEEIAFQQPISAEEFLRELPGVVPAIGPAVNNGANGSATLNLRGLGTNRNLVLLNERRVVPATLGGVVDLNLIPVSLLERVDVFTGGASSVYGADAVAGVVNFITKRDFAGVELNANYGITDRGDGALYRVDFTAGANFDDGRGNAVFSISRTKTDPVLQGERDIGLESRSSNTGLPQGSVAAAPATILAPFVAAVVPGQDTFQIGATNNFNFNPLNVFQTPLDRWSIFGQARYEVSPAIEVYSEGFFVRSEVTQQIAPSATFFNAFRLPLNNQFLTPAQSQQLCQAGVDIDPATPGRQAPTAAQCDPLIASGTEINAIVARRFVEAGPRLTSFVTNTYQVTAGARGPLTSNLDWNLSAQHGRSERTNTSENQGLFDRFQQSIRGCPAGSASGCVPINIFGAEGTLTPEMFNFLNVPTFTFVNTKLDAAQAVVSGDLGFSSPFAQEPIGIAVGAEYRKYSGGQRGDAISSTPGAVLGAGGAFTTIEGSYDSKEVFIELAAPLVEDRPFFENLTLEAGFRYSDYSTSGGNETYKIGGSWTPIQDIKFRGVYSRAVRAPNLGELFAPVNTVLSNRATDPCQGTVAQIQARGPNNLALCQAQLAAVGAGPTLGTIPAPFAGQINVTVGGNPELDPEIAKTFTAGVVLQPRFVPGFSATIDYFKIKVSDAVSAPSQSDIIDGCFSQADPSFGFCQLIFRNPLTGGLSGDPSTTRGPILQSSNLGEIETDGVDFGASYRRDLGFARLNWNLNATYTNSFTFQALPTTFARQCVKFYSVSCDPPQPKFTMNMRTTLSFGDTDVSVLWRHLSKTEVEPRTTCAAGSFEPGDEGNCGPAGILEDYQNIPSYNYFDLALQHSIGRTMRMVLTVSNLFDKDPPDVGNTVGSTAFNSGNTYPTVYDAIGRRYTVGVNLRF